MEENLHSFADYTDLNRMWSRLVKWDLLALLPSSWFLVPESDECWHIASIDIGCWLSHTEN